MLELPDAPPYEWSVERDVPRGDVRLETAAGRRVWVYTPPRPPQGVLVLFDGLAYTTIAPAPVVLDNLVAAERIPPLVAVLPDSIDTATRWRELACNPDWLDTVVEELVPLAGVEAGPETTVVAGSSLGGVAAAHAALERPDVFGNALVQSGAWPAVPGEIERRLRGPRLPVRWYLDVGTLEDVLLEPGRDLRDLVEERGYKVTYREFPGGHDFFWWKETLAWGLLALLGE
jgi:enterochelin esterase family protein